ncbi:MAG: glycoside hydrolase family 9 protein [Melioribacteraceae bacterium]|nr:glycoside hydrolase family 9 protein [Melioribacteraceae bacterium]MCF8354558.1 glycoside hydrolase family 9 protein [Melioribacteraceae bacterium]MCF8394490.1 glycoside hydrolase family 9 protein [Melioribacteraceae bacterium]MCF8420100.1 glycoside hydrolase family 9 protein [Melioribacteraceae bacterium]
MKNKTRSKKKSALHVKRNILVFLKFILAFTLPVLLGCSATFTASPSLHIRINQVGFHPDDIKSGVVLSKYSVNESYFELVDDKNKLVVHKGELTKIDSGYGNFPFVYNFDLSEFKEKGNYFIRIGSSKSFVFEINEGLFYPISSHLLDFFKIQRCGYTNPELHDVCHIADATSLNNNNGEVISESFDVTGGWHDAGDYVKFLNTTAFATYMLLFSYEFDPVKFGFDNNNNSVPDILEEAKVGLDWMLRCRYDMKKLVIQVQDLRDHDVGWRMPEDDELKFDRPGYLGNGKNIVGIYVAAMSLAYRIWNDVLSYPVFAEECLKAAENVFSVRDEVPDVDSTGSGMYFDKYYRGKLALGAVELYLSTNRDEILEEAKRLADAAGPDYWWSWGDVNTLAHYKLAKIEPRFKSYIENNLTHYNKTSYSNTFGKGNVSSWGTNHTLVGIILNNILYKDLTNSSKFDTLSIKQRDFLLGNNPWGISFIQKTGSNYSKSFHHQISFLKNIELPGGFAAGPVTREIFEKYEINLENEDWLKDFQTDEAIYFDDRNDYLTNEPTIVANATAIFAFASFK